MPLATGDGQKRTIILVKHALPSLDPRVPACEWRLGAEGEAQARQLAARLRPFSPFELVSSHETKARRTAELVGTELDLSVATWPGLDELDRPALPLLSVAEHAAMNAPIFREPTRRVLGRESAAEATERFRSAITALGEARAHQRLVIISHGTVIALLVAAHNDVDAFTLWRRLGCGSFVVLTYPGLKLVSDVESLA